MQYKNITDCFSKFFYELQRAKVNYSKDMALVVEGKFNV
jgi:hypothetical protein